MACHGAQGTGRRSIFIENQPAVLAGLLSMENPQLGWGFRKAFSFKPVIKTPFDLLKHLAVCKRTARTVLTK